MGLLLVNSTTIESMSTFRNLVWHKFEIITHMHGPQFKSYNVHRIETSMLSLVLRTFNPPHTRYILLVLVNLPVLTTLGSYRFPTHIHSSLHVSISNSLNYTTPFFHSVTKCIYLTHPPLHPMPSSLSLSPSPSHPLALNTCIAYLAPQPLMRTHARCISRSLPQDCLIISSARRATLAQSRSLYLSLV